MKGVETGHIVIEPDVLGGAPHIVGHRISVSHIAVWVVLQHARPEEVAAEFGLSLGEVHAALAYYYDHRDEIDHEIAVSEALADEMAQRHPRGWRPDDGPLAVDS